MPFFSCEHTECFPNPLTAPHPDFWQPQTSHKFFKSGFAIIRLIFLEWEMIFAVGVLTFMWKAEKVVKCQLHGSYVWLSTQDKILDEVWNAICIDKRQKLLMALTLYSTVLNDKWYYEFLQLRSNGILITVTRVLWIA